MVCTNCRGGALVKGTELRLYQVKWEEELRQVLEELRRSTDGDDRPGH